MLRPTRAALAAGACSLIVVGFFLPWVEGANLMDFRSFSGFDLARLVRNFEINADSDAGVGQVRATALSLYLVPGLAVNAMVMECVAAFSRAMAPAVRVAALVCGAYVLLVLAVLVFLAQVPVNGFEVVAGAPSWGFVATALGGVMFACRGALAPSPNHEPI